MSTRGDYGFHRNGKDKGSYCQSDAYPSWLGKSIFGYVKSRTPEQMAATFDAIKMVEDDEKPTKKQMARVLAANKAAPAAPSAAKSRRVTPRISATDNSSHISAPPVRR